MEDKNKSGMPENEHVSTSMALDDEQRIRVLSPTMLVVKRFLRNRLAIVGLVILVAMFLFCYLGGALSPYGETQIFYKEEPMSKAYASAMVNDNLYYTAKDGEEFPGSAQAAMILAVNKGERLFSAGEKDYAVLSSGEGDGSLYQIYETVEIATGTGIRGIFALQSVEGHEDADLGDEFKAALAQAVEEGVNVFEYNGEFYSYSQAMRQYSVCQCRAVAMASKTIVDMYSPDSVPTYEFRLAAEKAALENEKEFEVDGVSYRMEEEEDSAIIYQGEQEYARLSNMIMTPSAVDVFLSIDFKDAVQEAVEAGNTSFDFPGEDGAMVHYTIERKDFKYDIKTDTTTLLIDTYAAPSAEHPVGTDGFGMDLLTRLMYGGRISLMIGFVVVIIEVVLGIILGGISGYFSGWVDTIIMRLVDIFNCIPSMPIYIILGTAMSAMNVPSQYRIFYLMMILGILSWPSVARVVRGQILSLREQEFMLATEATGISTSRRIFRHLVPNVIPQIIVYATMGLGSVILMEATLSFLGLGVRYPYASWGNIVNAVNDSYVLTHFWFVWIPAGLLILITVLGFNFVGDGLRDAFDPKMKR